MLHWHCYSPLHWLYAAVRKTVGHGVAVLERMRALSLSSSHTCNTLNNWSKSCESVHQVPQGSGCPAGD